MSATTAPTTWSDIYTDLQNRVRDATGVTATQNIAKRYTQIALYDMHIGYSEKMPWCERNAILVTQPRYSTGTVTITQGSTTLTGTSTLWTTANAFGVNNARAGGKIVIAGTEDVYEVSSVGGAGTITLGSRYVGEDVTDTTYYYFEDEYALATDFLRPIDLQRFSSGAHEIEIVPRQDFRRRFPDNKITGKPVCACIVDEAPSGNTTPVRRVRFHKPPDQAYSIPYTYVTANLVTSSSGTAQTAFSADTDEPIVPLRYRHLIVLHALYNWYRDRKDDARSQEVLADYQSLLNRVVNDNEVGGNRARITPRVSGYRWRARKPWSSGRHGGRFDINGRFDRME